MDNNKKYYKILIPVDFSNYSLNACRYAFNIAISNPCEIILFHACYSPAIDLIELAEGRNTRKKLDEEVRDCLIKETECEFEKFKGTLQSLPEAENYNVKDIHSIIRIGLIEDEIINISREFNPDIVIMGTHGRNNSTSNMLGSITEYAINKLSIPVLAIPSPEVYSPTDIISIIYLTNFDETDFQSIRKLMELTGKSEISIHCLHIGGGDEERKKTKLEGLIEYFSKVYNYSNMIYNLLSLNQGISKIQSIENYINQNRISIISLTYKKRNIIEKYLKTDLTKKIFYRIKIPLLVFHS